MTKKIAAQFCHKKKRDIDLDFGECPKYLRRKFGALTTIDNVFISLLQKSFN